MKYVKMFALAAVAVTALVAVAASSASASAKVCSTATTAHTPTTACTAGHGWVYQGKISAKLKTGTNAVLKATTGGGFVTSTVTCTGSESEGEVTNGTTGTGKLTKLTFTGCSSSSCSGAGGVTASSTASAATPWAATATTTIPGTENGNGIMDVSNATGQFTCDTGIFGHVTCKYEVSTAQPHVTGSDTEPLIVANAIILTTEPNQNSLCGAHASWTATYKVTTPSSLWVE